MKLKYWLILIVFLLMGCKNVTINKNSFITKIDSKMNNMLIVSDQELENYYNIDLTKFKDYIFKVSNDNPTNIYILVLPTDKKEATKEIDKFFSKKAELSNDTDKERIKARYESNFGEYLFYIVSNNNKEIYKEMNEFIKNE